MVAFFVSTYMALYQWRLIETVWDPVFGSQMTHRVLDSDVSHRMQRWFGMPDAGLGAIAYLGDAVLGLAGSAQRWRYRPWLVLLFGLDVIPLALERYELVVPDHFLDLLRVGLASERDVHAPDALRRGITGRAATVPGRAVNLHQHRVVNIVAKSTVHGVRVGPQAVSR